jgi:hypothetical protein
VGSFVSFSVMRLILVDSFFHQINNYGNHHQEHEWCQEVHEHDPQQITE